MINSINNKDCVVTVEFDIGSTQYKIRRGMRPQFLEVFIDGKLQQQEAGALDNQEILEKRILRMNHRSFCQIVIIGSATFVPFMQLNPGARREIIEDLLDLQVFSKMNRLLKTRADENRTDLSDIRYQLDLTDEKIKMQNQYISDARKRQSSEKEDNKNKIESAYEEIESLRTKVDLSEREIAVEKHLISDLDKVNSKLSKYSTVEAQLKERLSKTRKDLKFYSDNDHCPTCTQAIEEQFKCTTVSKKTKTEETLVNGLSQLQEEKKTLQFRLLQIAEHQTTISDLQSNIRSFQSEISALQKYITQLESMINSESNSFTEEAEQSKLTVLYESRNELEKRKEELINQKATFDVASILLKDGGIKSKIIKQYIPIINAEINKYLAVLDLNVQFELDESFKETIKSRFREEFSYESFSEGEKARISLAIMFAWRSIAAMRNSSNTNLLILDEVADGGVDAEGIDDLGKILRTLKDTHVFVISHRESIREKFSTTLMFEKHKGFSRIVED